MSRGVRQDFAGWIWVGVGALATLALPVWALFTAVIIQLSPELWVVPEGEPSLVDDPGNAGPTSAAVLLSGAVAAARTLSWGLIPALGLAGVALVASGVSARRRRAQRMELDAEVAQDAVIAGQTLRVQAHEAGAGLGTTSDEGGAPIVHSPDHAPVAEPWSRVGAFLIDMGFLELTLLPAQLAMVRAVQQAREAVEQVVPDFQVALTAPGTEVTLLQDALVLKGLLLSAPLVLAYLAIQTWMLARGQTIGKWRLGLRIVGSDGLRVGLENTLLIRTMAFGALLGVPVIGWLVLPLVDLGLLFGEDRRTVKDLLAGTIVVQEAGSVAR